MRPGLHSRPDRRWRRKAASKSAAALRLKSDFTLLTYIKVGPCKISSLRAPGPQLNPKFSRPIICGTTCFRHRRIARPQEGVAPGIRSRSDRRLRRKAASKSAAALRSKSDFTLLTLIKVGPRKIFSMRGPRAQTRSRIKSAHHWLNPLLPAPADSPSSVGSLPLSALSSGLLVAEKGGLEVGGSPLIKVGLHAFNFD